MPLTVLTELHYLPSVPFFQQLLPADVLLLEAQENYRKQTFRNRCLVLTAQGPQPLTVPVVDGARSEKIRTADVEIDYRQNWPHRHFRTLQTAYGSSPYFALYADYLHDIYARKPVGLFDLNSRFLHLLLRCLRWPLRVEQTAQYLSPFVPSPPPSPFLDLRNTLTPKAAAEAKPDKRSQRPYAQVFGPAFVPGLSLLDLLFTQGPAAGRFL